MGNIRQVPDHEAYRLVGGNTGSGVYDDGGPFKYYIDVTKIPEMRGVVAAADPFTLGAATTLASAIELMTSRSQVRDSTVILLGYFGKCLHHLSYFFLGNYSKMS